MRAARSGEQHSVLERRRPNHAESFLAHLEPLQRVLEAYCRRSVRDGDDVADVLQAAIAKAFRDFHEFQQGTNFRAWIFRYVSLEVLNRNRAAARSPAVGLPADLPANEPSVEIAGSEGLADAVLNHAERIFDACEDQVVEAIREMPSLERSVFLLRAIGEFQYREIAEVLAVPMGTVMGLLARGRSRLRSHLYEYARRRGLLSDKEGG